MDANQSFFEVIEHGGLTLLLLVLMSLWSWVIIMERWMKFSRAEKGSDRLSARVSKLARAGQMHEARELAGGEEGCLGRLLHMGVTHTSRDKEVLEEALQRKAVEETSALETKLGTLGTIGSVAPYVGLFGTVLGIIHAFSALAKGGQDAGAGMVSAGIAEALITTAAGLAVAVPAVVFYNTFARRLSELDTKMALASSELVEACFDKTPGRRGDADEKV
jgi:biopolymer transport protein ExbB/TolQ